MSGPQTQIRFQSQGKVLQEYLASKKPIQIIRGPVGSRKTTETCYKVLKLICNQRPGKTGVRSSRVAILRTTYPELTGTTIRDWRKIVTPEMGHFTMGTPPEHKLDFDLPDGTCVRAEVLFIAMDKPEQVERLRGAQLTFAWMNEVKLFEEYVLNMVFQRVDRYPFPGWSPYTGVFGDTNAWDQDHWLARIEQEWRDGKRPDVDFFIQPGAVKWDDATKGWVINPERENAKFVPAEYYERQLLVLPQDRIRVDLANEIGLSLDGKPVQPAFSDMAHTAKTLLKPYPGEIVVGLDFGLTPAAVFWQRQHNGQWYALDELACFDMGAPRFAEELKRKMAQLVTECRVPEESGKITFKLFGDPSGGNRDASEDSYFTLLRKNGVSAFKAPTNEPSIRREALNGPLTRMVDGLPCVQINARCKNFRKALAGGWCYRRVQGQHGRFHDQPDKSGFSHVGEAGEYGLLSAGENATHGKGQTFNVPAGAGPIQMKTDWDPRA